MFSGASKYAFALDNISLVIFLISLVLLLGVTIVMVYFVFKFHHTRNPKPTQFHGSTALEVAWIAIPTFIVVGMFYVGFKEYITLRTTPDIDYHANVRAAMWKWTFTYPNGKTVDSILVIPVNKTTKLEITSSDILHSFYLKDFRIKEDAVPNMKTFAIITPNQLGTFRVACAEYCGAGNNGAGHFNMYARVRVIPQDEFNKYYAHWYKKEQTAAAIPAEAEKKH